MNDSDAPNRVLPGDLVCFQYVGPQEPWPDVQVIERIPKERVHESDGIASAQQKESMRKLVEKTRLTNPRLLYLVVAASSSRSFLVSMNMRKFLVAFNKDIRQL